MTGIRIDAEGVRVRYGALVALDGVDVSARAGEVLALLGPSGSGKTTLLRVLHLIATPQDGVVRVDGEPAPPDGPARRALVRRFGLVQQRPGFLAGSAVANAAFPLRARGVPRAEADARAREALERVGLAGARVDSPVTRLSGGEGQRVSLARAIATRPDALLLDEFTNHLDPVAEELAEAIVAEERARGAAIVLVTHRVSQARRLADRVAFLADGRVVEEGAAERVLHEPAQALVRRFLARA